jgi:hypothetical protein
MRIFYAVWLVLCCAWGYLFTTFGATSAELPLTFSLAKSVQSLLSFGALFFAGLWFNKVPASEATLGFSKPPWRSWLIALQLVTLTFLASGLWGLLLVGAGLTNGNTAAPFGASLMGATGFSSLWLACQVYRRVRSA